MTTGTNPLVRRLTTGLTSGKKNVNILVMGCTGTGKTTFTNLVSNSTLRIGVGLESCTDVIQKSEPFVLDGFTVTLVDTPGFDDSTKSDADVLNIVADYLREEFAKRRRLHGVIYFHRITDNRMSGSGLRSLKLFQQLCGDVAMKNCVIVTNMWNQVQEHVGVDRETELKTKEIFFKPALDHNAGLFRHDGSLESAQKVLRHMLHHDSLPLAIQLELVREKKPIYETAAGKGLLGELAIREEQHQRELDALKRELEDAKRDHDRQAEEEIQETTQRALQARAAVTNERDKLLGSRPPKKARGGLAWLVKWTHPRRLIGTPKRRS